MLLPSDFAAPNTSVSPELASHGMKKKHNSSKERGNKENKREHCKDPSQLVDSREEKSGRKFKKNKREKQDLSVSDKIFSDKSHKKPGSEKSSMYNSPSNARATSLRKRVDPETAKYFSEIANLFESNEVDLEILPTVCANALEETRGKEVELATDMIISRTLQRLLEGCDLEQLCAFVRCSSEGFSLIAVDKFGSHVAETAIKSLAMHLQDDDQSYSMVEETLHKICQVAVADIVNLMCSLYGSHVLRSLFCLLKGVELSTLEEFHVTKPSAILMERLSSTPAQPGRNILKNLQNSFPDIFVFLVQETLNHLKAEISTLRSDRYSSFVLQSMLKLLVGDDEELLHAILVILGCQDNFLESKFNDPTHRKLKEVVMSLLEDTASSHLLEVIIQVAPEALYNKFLNVIFKGSLFRISSHRFGNFVMQALISSTRTQEQASLIWEELSPHLGQLLEDGKAGVVASILAAFQRLQTHVNEFCHALSVAVCPESESPSYIVPHLLFLDSYFREKPHWKWFMRDKMHVLGCIMLQNIFKISNNLIKPYVASITTMEADHVVETAKDVGGSHVLEAFLCSDVSSKQKNDVVSKLLGHFGELSLQPSGSFTVERSFNASNNHMRATIAAELLEVQSELSKTKHGPYLLRKLDIEGFARSPDQWKSRQASKAAAYRDFVSAFGSNDQAPAAPDSSQKAAKKKHDRPEKPIGPGDVSVDSAFTSTSRQSGKLPFLSSRSKRGRHASSAVEEDRKFTRNSMSSDDKPAVKSNKKRSSASELAELAAKSQLSQGDVRMLFDPKTFER